MPEFKFGRSFVLRTEMTPDAFGESWIEINYPFTCEFSIRRNNLGEQNTASFVIYNLSKEYRSRIYKDINKPEEIKAVQFYAGYAEKKGDMLPLCFNGNVKKAYSQRTGPDVRTIIEAFDGINSMGSANVSVTIPPGTPSSEQIAAVSKAISPMTNITLGTKLSDVNSRTLAIMSPSAEALAQVSGGAYYVDNQALYVLNHLDCLEGDVRLIDYNNGLIGTPKGSEIMIELDMLFEPRIKPSQWIELQSSTEKQFDGVYKVTGIEHKGVISGSVCGECTTSLTLMKVKDFVVVKDENATGYLAIYQPEIING